MDLLVELLVYVFLEYLLAPFAKLMKGIGAVIFSCFSLFRKTPSQHYHTESFEREVGLFWTGFIFVIALIIGMYQLVY